MGLNEYASQHYKNNYLTEVIVRLDFLGQIDEIRLTLPRRLANLISKPFPILEPQRIVAQQLQLGPEGVTPKDQPTQVNQWKFFGVHREKYLTLSSDAILTSHSKYTSFEAFLDAILPSLEYLSKEYQDLQVRRVGLRYINNLSPRGKSPFSWSKFVNRDMLCTLNVLTPKEAITRAFHNLEMNYGAFRLRFQFGIHNPDFPAPVRQRIFVMDLDAFSETPIPMSAVPGALEDYHRAIQSAFESNITQALRDEMNE
jgi:uncharacterized protein (TIGR04255 family)